MTISKQTTPVARKEHRCELCNRTIKPGERYERWEGVYDSAWQTIKTCVWCHRLQRDLLNIEVWSEDADGREVYAWLPEVDWSEVFIGDDSQLWRDRHGQWKSQWAAGWYPEPGDSTPGGAS